VTGGGAPLRVGVVILPDERWSSGGWRWAHAEQLGFDHAWTYDHLAWRSLRDSTWFSAVPTLAAAATTTTRIRLGPLVASPTFRHPVPFARELIALDDLSGGRIVAGIGAGGTGWDATVLGAAWSPNERADRFAEFVELTDRLLRSGAVSHRGRHYVADGARTVPGCVQQPRLPLAIAAGGPRGMRVAVRHADVWVTTGPTDAGRRLDAAAGSRAVAAQLRHLDDLCVAEGRDPASLRRLVLTGLALDSGLASRTAFEQTTGSYREAGITDLVVHWPRAAEPFAGDLAAFERACAPDPGGVAA